ncbi:uncharacterized protein LOC121386426 isoform X1 [Gigantopelta aegis]|uniref:uncharacterized protein LOC121386426 isoform X1 n=1 Tax=Gigantopelta aegis TaxID=1735272 RepID=UPI001B88DC3B|nr:uncharacterized protein LOC121386426 isoform X1 [Gigantopelta aegis]
MPFKGFLKLFGLKKSVSEKKEKPVRKHLYDEVSDEQIQTGKKEDFKRRPRAYDEIEIDDEDGPTMVDGSPDGTPDEQSSRTTKSLNYIEVDVQPRDPSSEVRRSDPPTHYSTVEVGADAGTNKRKVSIDLQE